MNVTIRLTALSNNAVDLFMEYLDSKHRKIKNIEVVKENPLTVDVTPKLNAFQRNALKRAMSKPSFREAAIINMRNWYETAMSKEGLDYHEYKIEVLTQ